VIEVGAPRAGYHLYSMSPARRRQDLVTAEELYELPDDGSRHELLRDLAIEVLSPGDRMNEVLGKVSDYLAAGRRVVWIFGD
jgi:hypothetical protein